MKAENLLLCGLWVGPGKRPVSNLLAPIAKSIRVLGTLGLKVRAFGALQTIHAKLVMGVFDTQKLSLQPEKLNVRISLCSE